MRIIKEGSCNADEQQVEFTATVMGTKIKACVSTKKQPVIIKNVTYYQGRHCVIQPYPNSPASELEIFNEYNLFGKEKGANLNNFYTNATQYYLFVSYKFPFLPTPHIMIITIMSLKFLSPELLQPKNQGSYHPRCYRTKTSQSIFTWVN